jgi:Zn-finger nucleic acid-binding protein
VDQKAFEGLAAHREDRGQVLGSLPGGERLAVPVAAVRYRPCPVCQKFMNRMNYARISGVVLDVCKDHGLWFDRDELRQVLAFIEGGGLERSRARQMADLEEKRRLAALPPPPSGGGGWMEDVPLAGPGNRGFESLLGGLLSALLKF